MPPQVADTARALGREVAAGRLDPEKIDEKALKTLVRAAVTLNASRVRG